MAKRVLPPFETLQLGSRKGNPIANQTDRRPVWQEVLTEAEKWEKEHKKAIKRPVAPSFHFNCHGLTFAARRTNITAEATLQQILSEDDYAKVPLEKVMPGDVALYISRLNQVDHSGIVIGVKENDITVLSRWGFTYEFIHPVMHCPYSDCRVEYRRIEQ